MILLTSILTPSPNPAFATAGINITFCPESFAIEVNVSTKFWNYKIERENGCYDIEFAWLQEYLRYRMLLS